jgi:hypothetical protein
MDNQHDQSDPERGHTLLEGLNLAGVVKQLKIPKSFYEASQSNEPAVSPDNRYLEVDSKPGNRNFQTIFGGLHVVEAFKIFNT